MTPEATLTDEAPPQTAGGRSVRPPRRARKRMLIIVNPYATTVSDRLKTLVVHALQGRYEVEAVMTEAQNHATEIGREAREGGYDIVVAFGGDGTLNEIANGLAGTDVPVSVLPGGSTNVVCRTLGIPNDVVDATEHLLAIADDFRPRRIDLGTANGRRFVFACGAGIDASTVRTVDAHPRLKSRLGPWYFTWSGISAFYREYLRDPVRFAVECEAGSTEGITAVVQNSDPFTYFANSPVRICDGADLGSATLSMAVLRRARQRDVPSIMGRVLSPRLSVTEHGQVDQFRAIDGARISSCSSGPDGSRRAFRVQVDGDYIGDFAELELGCEPAALTVVA